MPSKRIISYIVFITNKFSKQYGLPMNKAFIFLASNGVTQFLVENYEVEHQLSPDDVIEDMALIAQKNGGVLV